MAKPEYQQEFNDIIECIKAGTYKAQALTLMHMGLTDKDAAELCEAIRVATEAGICNIIELNLSNNQLTTFNGKGLTQLKCLYLINNQLTTFDGEGLTQLAWLFLNENQLTTFNGEGLTQLAWLFLNGNQFTTFNGAGLTQLEKLNLSGNQLTSLTHAKLSKLLPAKLLDAPNSGIMKPTPEERTKINNELNAKVAWAIQQYLNGKALDAIESELKSNLKKEGEDLLLTPEDSIYIMLQINQFNQCASDDTLLSFFPSNIKENVIQYMCLDSQNESEDKNENASDSPAEKDPIPPKGGIKP